MRIVDKCHLETENLLSTIDKKNSHEYFYLYLPFVNFKQQKENGFENLPSVVFFLLHEEGKGYVRKY